ncbi:MAG: hypothetical protein IKZ21_02420, partial [Clostridia bacterium]|nr:hypothetical protein [Clostridia bacterium]
MSFALLEHDGGANSIAICTFFGGLASRERVWYDREKSPSRRYPMDITTHRLTLGPITEGDRERVIDLFSD